MFALAGGAVEASFGGEGQNSTRVYLFRFTTSGAPDPSFASIGYTVLHAPVAALAIAPDGETFSVGTSGDALVLLGTLADGKPDPALGGVTGQRLAANLLRPAPGAGPQTVELLTGEENLSIRIGQKLVRLSEH